MTLRCSAHPRCLGAVSFQNRDITARKSTELVDLQDAFAACQNEVDDVERSSEVGGSHPKGLVRSAGLVGRLQIRRGEILACECLPVG
jgi:hypothetical protein